jgi:hypothetical protein
MLNDRLMRRLAERGHPEVRAPHRAVFEFLDDAGTQASTLAERAKLVVATARGREVYAIARELVDEIQAELDARIGVAKVARLRALLVELGSALDEAL